MAQQTINIGAAPNDGTGTPLRTSFDYTNQNFTELYTALGGGVGLPGATTQVIFNDGGTNLAGDAGLTYDKTTDALTVVGALSGSKLTVTGGTIPANGVYLPAANTLEFAANSLAQYRIAPLGVFSWYDGAGGTRMTLNSTALLVGVASANANGGVLQLKSGITFPATQVAATDVNTLDDYEEGTWTGTLKGSITDPTVAVTATGRYTKIGRQVFIDITFSNISNVGASGELSVTGLPFACNGSVNAFGSTSMNGIGTFAGGSPISIVVTGGTTLLFYGNVSGLPNVVVTHNTGTGKYFNASISYSV